MNFESKHKTFQSQNCVWKCRLPEWWSFCSGGDELTRINRHWRLIRILQYFIHACCHSTLYDDRKGDLGLCMPALKVPGYLAGTLHIFNEKSELQNVTSNSLALNSFFKERIWLRRQQIDRPPLVVEICETYKHRITCIWNITLYVSACECIAVQYRFSAISFFRQSFLCSVKRKISYHRECHSG